MALLITLLVSAAICGVIGMAIGDLGKKKNGPLGGLLGALLGPVGWIIVAILPAEAGKSEAKAAQAGGGMDSTKIIFGAIGFCALVLGGFIYFVSRL